MKKIDRYDNRSEWFREWGLGSSFVNLPPKWYWIGLWLSAFWLIIYLLIYPSIPLLSSHWQGLGVPHGCQPWTAICEMQQNEAKLNELRGKHLQRIAQNSVDQLLADREVTEFIERAGKVPFGDHCAGCHGVNGSGVEQNSLLAPKLNDEIWLYGGDAQSILVSIQNPTVHPFGLAKQFNQVTSKILALYVFNQNGLFGKTQSRLSH